MVFQFPNDCCETTSILFGLVILKINKEADIQIVRSKRHDGKHGRHIWIEIDGSIFDITADQFGLSYQPIYGEPTMPLLEIFKVYEKKTIIEATALNGWLDKLQIFDEVANQIIKLK
ncbi:hypothetical protein BTW08_13325 [Salinicola sp. MH3R3-1]|nr:hypothetical protein BTW08_13325 [Salinicola sp. MH3R3-1]